MNFHWHNFEADQDGSSTNAHSSKASASDLDNLLFDKAMRDIDKNVVKKWIEAAGVKISALEEHGA